ncbi:tRNA (5-methylaminomethyl-2-thiouridine)(34)-methyltransferase MnmD [Sandaracinobacter neustonicus]|uniref:tRNA 5-methylaminomethyl-2-thiouridine biosynthesis bifunctional protein MnmC n=1 Tax=Sandaracinobacter neustonicus TaxID=1715348 RepID=A0A501XFY9_9SPHN|nr:tRNA (5-methylaminomethyl-2-thiouridine)(34)-methyltransferase MnmD [Sandaracinobacter neustonicus]TPE59435.1 tRNA (5-methylaminomethyl-2-thiouridine)(34)-methyltransferase MnmD [Sandaracinobacter neustonicus]
MTPADPGAAWDGETLTSARFGDVYASRAGALAQSRAVFLAGCGLPERWQGRRRFTVGELGFGTGLNMLAVLDAWAISRPADSTLHLFSVEGFPLAKADAARALAAFPELADLAAQLLARWPDGARGLHRIDFPALGATLDLLIDDVAAALSGWQGRADAWFLDGFSPAKNPDMWSAEVLALVGERTAPGGRAATWSVAGFVRRGLAAAGFTVERLPGFTGKRERLAAHRPGEPTDPPLPKVAIIGAGIAGASLALALRDLGIEPTIFADGPMASGNPAALVSPRLAAGSEAGSALHALAFRRAVERINRTAPDAILARGAQRLLKPSELARADATLDSGLFPPAGLTRSGEALALRDALVVSPERLRAAWLGPVRPLAVDNIARVGDGWQVQGEGPFDAVVIAAGFGSAALSGLPLRPIRGQVTTATVPLQGPPTSWGGYIVPTDDGLLFGATHGRGDADPSVRAEDQQHNLETLARVKPELAAALASQKLGAIAGVRAAAGDHQPIAGTLGDGLYMLGAFGGRGFALAPLLAEHVAAEIAGTPSPLTPAMARLLDPSRFAPKGDSAAFPPASPSAA